MKERQKDLKYLSEEEYWKLQIFFANGNCLLLLNDFIVGAFFFFKHLYFCALNLAQYSCSIFTHSTLMPLFPFFRKQLCVSEDKFTV